MDNNSTTTLNLLTLEMIGSAAWMLGSIILIFASSNSQEIIIITGTELNPLANIVPDITTYRGRIVLTIGGFIAAITATVRLIQREEKILEGKPILGTLVSNKYVFIGLWISFIGTFIVLIGDRKRIEENQKSIPVY